MHMYLVTANPNDWGGCVWICHTINDETNSMELSRRRDQSYINPLLQDVMKKLQEYVDDINENIQKKLDTRGPVSRYVLGDENLRGSLTITFDEGSSGVACNLESRGYHVLCKATEEVVGHVKPYSITGSLPLIRELQDEGFDVQTAGYGLMATYHAKNEYCLLKDMCQGYGVFVSIISQLEN